MSFRLRWVSLVILVSSALALGLVQGAYSAEAARSARAVGSDPWIPGQVYRGDFPDPTVLRAGPSYYGYSTGVAGLNLPVLVSTNLSTWRAADPVPATGTVDAMPDVASWAWSRTVYSQAVGSRHAGVVWAPSVARIAGQYVAAYTTRLPGPRRRMCISVATSSSPRGPFVDRSTRAVVCPVRGAIDPQLYVEKGKVWLLYKTEDISIGRPTRLWIRRLGSAGLAFTPGSKPHLLLTAKMDWERRVVEAPAMIRYRGQRYLFYSGNGWGRPGYAIGYARCASVFGPCKRVLAPHLRNKAGKRQSRPLLAGDKDLGGPGGATPFIDLAGRLRLAYHAWGAGFSHYPDSAACRDTPEGCAQRQLHVATVKAGAGGRLWISNRGLGQPASLAQ